MPDVPQPGPGPASSVRSAANSVAAQRVSDFPFAVTVSQVYEGPLDLLLDLIRKQDIDIYDIPIARITAQFLTYVERMKQFDVDIAAEFIYMASLLIHIKSKMLLPRPETSAGVEGDEEDPRDALVRRLLEHQKFKAAAGLLHEREQARAQRKALEQQEAASAARRTRLTQLGIVVAIASSILAYPLGSSSTCSTTGIRWQLMPTVDNTVYGRCGSAGRSVTPVRGCRPADVSQ